MTPADVAEVLARIVDQMPHVKYGPRALDGFYDGLMDLDADDVFNAVRTLLRRSEYGLTVAAIRDEVYQMRGIVSAEDAWRQVLAVTQRQEPTKVWRNPLISGAIASVGGLATIRMTEHPELLRKDFMQAYGAMRRQELGAPDRVQDMMGITDGGAGKLAGTSEADRAAKAAGDHGQHGSASSGEGRTGIRRLS